jgi:3-hydroxyisobutyrate dehydrogenase
MADDKLGFIGLGAMGLGVARSLVRGGLMVAGYDVRAEARAALVEAGGDAVDEAALAARDAAVLILCVVSAQQIDDLLFGPNDCAGVLPEGATVVCSATVPPAYARALGERLAARGLHLLDAPISGGAAAAEAGQLTVMAAGSAEAFAAAAPALDAMARKTFRLGETPGLGSTVKAVNQLMAGVNLVTAAEGMAFGAKLGADPEVLLEVLTQSAGGSWMLANRGPAMVSGDFTPLSAMTIWRKDLGIVLDTARELGLPTPMAATAFQIALRGIAAGWGDLSDAALVKVYEQDGGMRVSAANDA